MRFMARLEHYLGFHLFVIHARPLDNDPQKDSIPNDAFVRILNESELVGFANDSDGSPGKAGGFRRM